MFQLEPKAAPPEATSLGELDAVSDLIKRADIAVQCAKEEVTRTRILLGGVNQAREADAITPQHS